ncbi:MAG: hypothetical protein QW743_06910 [Candidatus Methanomethylicia archaeon]
MFDNSSNFEIIDLCSLLLDCDALLLGSFGALKKRFMINCSVIDCSDWENCLVVDPHGLYKYLGNTFTNFKLLKLGFNASINPFTFKSDDAYSDVKFIVDIFRLSFHLSEDSARLLQFAITNLIGKGNFNPTIKDIILEVESQGNFPGSRFTVHRLIRFLDLMLMGRVGSSFNSYYGFSNLDSGLFVVDISHLPVEFRVFSSLLILHRFSKIFDLLLIEDVDLLAPALVRALREEYAISFERSMIFYDLIKSRNSGITLLSCENPVSLSSRIRSILDISFSPLPSCMEYFDSIMRLFTVDFNDLKFLKFLDNERFFLCFINGDIKVVNYSLKPEFKGEFDVVDELGISKPVSPSILEKLFGSKADLAHNILSFLSQGTVERDLVIGYITSVLGIDSQEAKKILTILLVYGLVFESMHRDGRYYVRLSPMGASVLEDYSRVRGG